MSRTFDDAYTEYQEVLAQLNDSDDIGTKNALFKRLTGLLVQMEQLIVSPAPGEESSGETES